MKYLLLIIFFLLVCCKIENKKKPNTMDFKEIHNDAILIDSHNDFLTKCIEEGYLLDTDLKGKTHTDLNRLKEGNVDVQFFSVWCDENQVAPFHYANKQIDALYDVIKRNPKRIELVPNSKMLLKTVNQKKIAALIGIEGGHMIEDDLNNLDAFYNRGVRYMTLTHNNSTAWASSAAHESSHTSGSNLGLIDFGKDVVKRMNTLGMMVDISHVGEQTFWDVLQATTKPIIASHSSVYNICPHPRNLKDDQIKAIAKNKGVIQVNFFSLFLDKNFEKDYNAFLKIHESEKNDLIGAGMNKYSTEIYLMRKYKSESDAIRPKLDILIEHINYIVNLIGIDYVGLGSDFDGIPSTPLLLDDVTCYNQITKLLVKQGYSKEDIHKILGGNLIRVMQANE
jgi:membrane dipeptidase